MNNSIQAITVLNKATLQGWSGGRSPTDRLHLNMLSVLWVPPFQDATSRSSILLFFFFFFKLNYLGEWSEISTHLRNTHQFFGPGEEFGEHSMCALRCKCPWNWRSVRNSWAIPLPGYRTLDKLPLFCKLQWFSKQGSCDREGAKLCLPPGIC